MYIPLEIKQHILSYLPCPIYQRQRRRKLAMIKELTYRRQILYYVPMCEIMTYFDYVPNYNHSLGLNLIFLSLIIYPWYS